MSSDKRRARFSRACASAARVAVFWLLSAAAFAAEPSASVDMALPASFEEANAHYKAGDYEAAARLYEELAHAQGKTLPEIHYNLGNAYFRAKKLGRAILSYERARRLSPRDPTVRRNLAYARSLVGERSDAPSNWYAARATDLLYSFTAEEWRLATSAVLALIFTCLAAHFAVYRGTMLKRAAVSLSVLFVFGASFWAARILYDANRQGAVVTSPQAEMRYGPSLQEPVAFRISEGFLVWRAESREGWVRVILPNGEQGWVEQEKISFV